MTLNILEYRQIHLLGCFDIDLESLSRHQGLHHLQQPKDSHLRQYRRQHPLGMGKHPVRTQGKHCHPSHRHRYHSIDLPHLGIYLQDQTNHHHLYPDNRLNLLLNYPKLKDNYRLKDFLDYFHCTLPSNYQDSHPCRYHLQRLNY